MYIVTSGFPYIDIDAYGVMFDGPIAPADRLWLRKEIIKQDVASRA